MNIGSKVRVIKGRGMAITWTKPIVYSNPIDFTGAVGEIVEQEINALPLEKYLIKFDGGDKFFQYWSFYRDELKIL